jgi:hypothetical protein
MKHWSFYCEINIFCLYLTHSSFSFFLFFFSQAIENNVNEDTGGSTLLFT